MSGDKRELGAERCSRGACIGSTPFAHCPGPDLLDVDLAPPVAVVNHNRLHRIQRQLLRGVPHSSSKPINRRKS